MSSSQQDSESGVSPVVGVILVVAVTVVLSATIGVFVLDLGGTVSENPSVGVSTSANADGSEDVTVVDMGQADYVLVKYNGTSTQVNQTGSSVTVPQNTTYSVIGVMNGDETLVLSDSTIGTYGSASSTATASTLVFIDTNTAIGTIGNGGSDYYGQNFTGNGEVVTEIAVHLVESNSEGEVTVTLVPADANGHPDESTRLWESSLTNPTKTGQWYNFTVPEPTVNDGQTYFVLIDGYNNGGTGTADVGANTSAPGFHYSNDGGSSWTVYGDGMSILVKTK